MKSANHDHLAHDYRFLRALCIALVASTSAACDEAGGGGDDEPDDDAGAEDSDEPKTPFVELGDKPAESYSGVTLWNHSFESAGPCGVDGLVTTLAVSSGGTSGLAAADRWTTHANTPQTSINTWQVSTPWGLGILVANGGAAGGIVQNYTDICMGNLNHVTALVNVVAGKVDVGVGDDGVPAVVAGSSNSIGAWQWVGGCAPLLSYEEVQVYGRDGAVFYVEDVVIDYSQNCECQGEPECEYVEPICWP